MTADKQHIEFSDTMRMTAEKNIQQARLAFDSFISAARKNAAVLEWRATNVQSGAKEIWQKAIGFTDRNVAASLELAQRLSQANNLREVVELQSAFAQTQMRALADHAIEMSQTVATIITEPRDPKK
jgi:phasin